MSFDRLQEKIDKMRNPTVVGLDPELGHIPPQILEKHIKEKGETLEAAAAAVFEFNTGLIDALCGIVPAVKPQSAYYEALGPEGVRVLKMTCDYAKSKGMFVICDVKRNDIGTTAQAYSAAYLGAVKVGGADLRPFDADAITINAYLGSDGIKPFIEAAVKYDKAVFALVRTSNPSAGELQDLFAAKQGEGAKQGEAKQGDGSSAWQQAEEPSPCLAPSPCLESPCLAPSPCLANRLYTAVGDLIEELSRDTIGKYGFTRLGAVVGATYPEEAEFLRERLKHTFFLVPGYGAQGGSAAEARRSFNKDGRGAIVNSSRGIIAAWKKTGGDYKEAAYAEAQRMRDDLRGALS